VKKSVTHSTLKPATLTAESLTEGLRSLAERDADMARLLAELGAPPTWFREPGFPTLVHIILEQQISLASARAAFTRLLSVAAPLTPQNFLALDERQLKQVGFSRQKIIYARHLAQLISDGQLNLQALDALDDAGVKAELTKVKGIGAWTADIYLLMALRRPDAWPVGDLALAVAVQKVKRLAVRPAPGELAAIGEAWQPWRAVAARLLWHYYLMKG
jgi:DNA-3-methyladenine glycosylase II